MDSWKDQDGDLESNNVEYETQQKDKKRTMAYQKKWKDMNKRRERIANEEAERKEKKERSSIDFAMQFGYDLDGKGLNRTAAKKKKTK